MGTTIDYMKFLFNDGGRQDAGYKGKAGDCGARAIAIATGLSYQEVYDLVNQFGKQEGKSKRRRGTTSARTGVHSVTMRKIMAHLGWKWVPTMFIGKGCTVHLRAEELPAGRLLMNVSRHFTTVIDGVINDTYDCSREGTRCVYGYYIKP